jgi:xanthine dehydrogenase accessory factor
MGPKEMVFSTNIDTMHELHEILRVASEGRAALATVIRTAGSAPRRAGAHMAVRADGTIGGSVGGGRIELEVIEVARKVAEGSEPAQRVKKHLTHELAMCCGGQMELWIEPLDEGRLKALAEALRRVEARRPCLLITALDGSGKDVQSGEGPARLEEGRFVEPVRPLDRLVIFGAGHVARAVAPLAAQIGFEVVVCDEDERFASAERFPGAQLVPGFDVREAGAGDFALILTRDHAVDQALLEQLLPRMDLAYLGLIGSRGKLGRFKKRLEQKGIGDEAAWARLRSPVGLDIGAQTPEEIAVSIVAELIACARRR